MIFDGGVLLLNQYGTVVAAQPARPEILGQDWSSREFFQQLIRVPTTAFSNVVQDGPDGAPVIVVAVPITSVQLIGPRLSEARVVNAGRLLTRPVQVMTAARAAARKATAAAARSASATARTKAAATASATAAMERRSGSTMARKTAVPRKAAVDSPEFQKTVETAGMVPDFMPAAPYRREMEEGHHNAIRMVKELGLTK